MRRYLLNWLLGSIVAVTILSGMAWVPTAAAAEYKNPTVDGEDTPGYWIDRGGLLATYGNYPEAIKAYKKAMALDPNLSVVYFNLALAYCETGDFDQAQTAINRALSMAPDNARYLYGRGWILLQAYGKDKALPDFQKAADLGNQDALNYLQGHANKPAPGR